MRLSLAALAGAVLGGCAGAPDLAVSPGVRVDADPPPPHVYWAPSGSVVVNHPTESGIWIAQAADGGSTYYFGDACGAAARQDWIGRRRDELPDPISSGPVRLIEPDMIVTADLSFQRLNVEFAADGRVRRVYCS